MWGQSLGRRAFITGLGGAAIWPLAGHAKQPERIRRLGVLMGFSENDPFAQRIESGFANALAGSGWVEGKNIRIDYRFAAGDATLYKTYAAEPVGFWRRTQFSQAPRRRSRRCGGRRAQYRSFLYSCPIPSGCALFRVSHDRAATSPGSAPTTRRSWGKWVQLLKEIAPSCHADR